MTTVMHEGLWGRHTKGGERGLEGWHFLRGDRRLQSPLPDGSRPVVEAGQTLRVTGWIQMCERGLHASRQALDALGHAPSAYRLVISRVVLGPPGFVVETTDKAVAPERTCLWWADATETLHQFVMDCVERAFHRERTAGREPNPRLWKALAVKRRWLAGKATDTALQTARDAAETIATAAWSTAQSAPETAAGAAAMAALRATAEFAGMVISAITWAAIEAAWEGQGPNDTGWSYAAWNKERAWQQSELEKRLWALR